MVGDYMISEIDIWKAEANVTFAVNYCIVFSHFVFTFH